MRLFVWPWVFGLGFIFLWLFIGTTRESALFWSTALNVAAIFTPITYLHFVTVFLGIYEQKKKLVKAGWIFSFVIFATGFTPLFISGVRPIGSIQWYPIAGPSYHPFLIEFAAFVFYCWYLMFKNLKEKKGESNLPVRYLLIGTLLGFTGGATNFFNLYGIPIPPYGNGLVVFIFIFTALAISKYHLFEVRVVLTELLVVIIAGVSLAEALLFKTFWTRFLGFGAFVLFCLIGYLLIKSMHKELGAKEILEQRVRERTAELQGSNDKLEQAYNEVKGQREELEKFYKLTIGREVRMAELKQKIKEMESAQKPD